MRHFWCEHPKTSFDKLFIYMSNIRKILLVRSVLAVCCGAFLLDTFLEPSGLTDVLFSLISFAIIFVVLSVVLYVAGNIVVGRKKTSMKNAFTISVLGTLVLIVCQSVFSLELATVLSFIAWLLLVRYYYETGVLGSIGVGVASVIVSVIILFVLSSVLAYSLLFILLPIFIAV